MLVFQLEEKAGLGVPQKHFIVSISLRAVLLDTGPMSKAARALILNERIYTPVLLGIKEAQHKEDKRPRRYTDVSSHEHNPTVHTGALIPFISITPQVAEGVSVVP